MEMGTDTDTIETKTDFPEEIGFSSQSYIHLFPLLANISLASQKGIGKYDPAHHYVLFDFDNNAIYATDRNVMLKVYYDFKGECSGYAYAKPEIVRLVGDLLFQDGKEYGTFRFENKNIILNDSETICLNNFLVAEEVFSSFVETAERLIEGSKSKEEISMSNAVVWDKNRIGAEAYKKGMFFSIDRMMPFFRFLDETSWMALPPSIISSSNNGMKKEGLLLLLHAPALSKPFILECKHFPTNRTVFDLVSTSLL